MGHTQCPRASLSRQQVDPHPLPPFKQPEICASSTIRQRTLHSVLHYGLLDVHACLLSPRAEHSEKAARPVKPHAGPARPKTDQPPPPSAQPEFRLRPAGGSNHQQARRQECDRTWHAAVSARDRASKKGGARALVVPAAGASPLGEMRPQMGNWPLVYRQLEPGHTFTRLLRTEHLQTRIDKRPVTA